MHPSAQRNRPDLLPFIKRKGKDAEATPPQKRLVKVDTEEALSDVTSLQQYQSAVAVKFRELERCACVYVSMHVCVCMNVLMYACVSLRG